MAKLINICGVCQKPAQLLYEERVEKLGIFKTYDCGHSEVIEIIAQKFVPDGYKLICTDCKVEKIEDQDFSAHLEHSLVEIPTNRHMNYALLRPYQQAGVNFLEQSNFNALIGDEMGLGKTIQVLHTVREHSEKLTPTLIVVKSALKLNWAKEMMRWLWTEPRDYPFVIMDGQMAILPGFKYYIVSMNMLEKAKKTLTAMPFKLLIVDESQNFASVSSQRTLALLEIAENIPHRICMSGTPVMNRASEYWPTLNLIRPDEWMDFSRFRDRWIEVETTESGNVRYTGIKPKLRQAFFEKTKNYVIRRRKRDVLTDLPAFTRNFIIVDISDSNLKVSYNKQAKELENYMNSKDYYEGNAQVRSSTILGYLMRMRHIAGVAKVPIAVDQVLDFLASNEDEKIIIGCHHDDVFRSFEMALASFNPVLLGSGLDNFERDKRIEEFRLPERRVCIAKILAQGEGLNLQFCNNMLIHERMWNPAKEEQFEARIDRYGQKSKTNADYMIAKNTVDEVFTAMVEEKRKICGETVDEDFNFEMDGNLLGMLAEKAGRLRL